MNYPVIPTRGILSRLNLTVLAVCAGVALESKATEIDGEPIRTFRVENPTTFTLTNVGATDYVFSWSDDGVDYSANDPVLLLSTNVTYTFNRASSSHPFGILDGSMPVETNANASLRRDSSSPNSFILANGSNLSGNPASNPDSVVWTPDTTGIFYYTCMVASHPNMTGRIRMVPDAVVSSAGMAAVKDAVLYEDGTGALANGSGDYLFAGNNGGAGGNRILRSLIEFDVASAVPAGVIITEAELSLTVNTPKAFSGTVSLHRVLQEWGEGASDAPSGEGGGTAALSDDATWLHTFSASSFWLAPGGDFNPAELAAQTISAGGEVTWSSSNLTADVQAMLDDPSGNHGWLLKQAVESGSAIRFASRSNATVSSRPELRVAYAPAPRIVSMDLAGDEAMVSVTNLTRNKVLLIQATDSLTESDFETRSVRFVESDEIMVSVSGLTNTTGFIRAQQ